MHFRRIYPVVLTPLRTHAYKNTCIQDIQETQNSFFTEGFTNSSSVLLQIVQSMLSTLTNNCSLSDKYEEMRRAIFSQQLIGH